MNQSVAEFQRCGCPSSVRWPLLGWVVEAVDGLQAELLRAILLLWRALKRLELLQRQMDRLIANQSGVQNQFSEVLSLLRGGASPQSAPALPAPAPRRPLTLEAGPRDGGEDHSDVPATTPENSLGNPQV